jgi:hypothetical protein
METTTKVSYEDLSKKDRRTIINAFKLNCKKQIVKSEIYWDREEELTREQVKLILRGQLSDVENDLIDYNYGYVYDLEILFCEEVISRLTNLDPANIDLHSVRDAVLDYIFIGSGIKRLADNTTEAGMVFLNSNYDCINSCYYEQPYTYYKNYFKDILDTLYLNPAKVKEVFNRMNIGTMGYFPDLKYRNGKEYVDYEKFASEILNTCCGAMRLCFIGKLPVADLINIKQDKFDKMYKVVTIPKGNKVGLFSDDYGGGSIFEMTLLRPMTVTIDKPIRNKTKFDNFALEIDGENGYSIVETYGVDYSFFGAPFQIKFKK